MFGTLELVAVSEGYQTVSSMRPAAEVFGVALGTVKSRTSRALGRLRHELESNEATEVRR